VSATDYAARLISLTDAEAEAEYRRLRDDLHLDYQRVTARGRRADEHRIGALAALGRTEQAEALERAVENRSAEYADGAQRKWLLAIRTGRYDSCLGGSQSGDPDMQAAIEMVERSRRAEGGAL